MIFALFYRSQVSPELQDTILRVLSELRLFRGEVVKEKIVFHSERERERERESNRKKMRKTKKLTESIELGSRKTINN